MSLCWGSTVLRDLMVQALLMLVVFKIQVLRLLPKLAQQGRRYLRSGIREVWVSLLVLQEASVLLQLGQQQGLEGGAGNRRSHWVLWKGLMMLERNGRLWRLQTLWVLMMA